MGETIKLSCTGTKKSMRRLVKGIERYSKHDKNYDLISVSEYFKIKKFPWLCRVVIKIEDKSNANQPRARP